jgi:hypothetical protein
MAGVALDRSLIFHRLQEARQELSQARSGHPPLPPHDRACLVARCEANVARAELELARATEADVRPPVQAWPGRGDGRRSPGNVGPGFEDAPEPTAFRSELFLQFLSLPAERLGG